MDPASVDPAAVLTAILVSLSSAVASGDLQGIKACFHPDQCYWRDQLAFTYHARTFSDATVPMTLYKRSKLAQPSTFSALPGARLTPAGPNLVWIDGFFAFGTDKGMQADCGGMVQLMQNATGDWKIWTLTTWINELKACPERSDLLTGPAKNLSAEKLTTEVLIIGAGNAYVAR